MLKLYWAYTALNENYAYDHSPYIMHISGIILDLLNQAEENNAEVIEHINSKVSYVPVAQLDRVLPSEGKAHRFDSCLGRHF